MTWMTWLALGATVLVVAALGATAVGSMRWAGTTQALNTALEAARAPPPTPRYDAHEIERLPAPVQRYFRAVLQDGQPIVAAATMRMAGRFNLSATGAQWRPFRSLQRVTTRRPGFLWDARIALLPGLTVRVVDSYIAGQGLLLASLQGLFTVADLRGGGDIARGEFMRYFAEAVWYPTALLPSQGVQWQAVDDRSADATMVDGPFTLSLRFRFDDAGRIESFRAESRGSMVGKVLVQAPWEGRFSNYQTRNGMSVPLAGEVAWMRPDGRKPYFEGEVTQLDHAFAP